MQKVMPLVLITIKEQVQTLEINRVIVEVVASILPVVEEEEEQAEEEVMKIEVLSSVYIVRSLGI